ncbi:MAG: hypothetical protein KF914_12765 [Rhizobiaceae bacterium]|nr:hypothetical protein [Rhizobiaceae bacterium]
MSSLRPMEPGDASSVARLYLRILKRRDRLPSPGLVETIRRFYCDGPFRQADIPSLVHVAEGEVTGFVGVHSVPMLHRARKLRAAYCGSLMVDNRSAAPLAGAMLLKTFLAGPQDVSISETANAVAQGMWLRLRGHVLAPNSLDWVRVLRPAGFGLSVALGSGLPSRALSPLARSIDALWRRRSKKGSLVQFLPDQEGRGLAVETVEPAEFLKLLDRFSGDISLRPDWSNGYGEHVLAEALDKPSYGRPVLAAAFARNRMPVGAFLYHLEPGQVARVLQLVAAPGHMTEVLPGLFADALSRGAVGLRGRSDAAVADAAPGQSIAFAPVASTLVHARDAELLASLRAGDGLVNGLAGERWSRLFGGGLD